MNPQLEHSTSNIQAEKPTASMLMGQLLQKTALERFEQDKKLVDLVLVNNLQLDLVEVQKTKAKYYCAIPVYKQKSRKPNKYNMYSAKYAESQRLTDGNVMIFLCGCIYYRQWVDKDTFRK
jgi:hypothetical protein